ncbi:uncharacterized protein LOC131242894 [Magnolia sinica]|uniref:uncharacterized protein LOC131242894 n=1 Tax=Magnolia sinica TaxID=86752 RepID=UPI002657FAFA|nr:uncharacterized protein LOC131242894 [Magnolia sinica]
MLFLKPMADFLQNSSKSRFQTAIWTVKLGFLAIGIISTFLLLKLAIPYSFNLFLSALPRVWISFRSWLSPPYLYIIVNFIIISIAASSSFQQKHSEKKIEDGEEETDNLQLQNQKQKQRDSDASSRLETTPTTTDIWSEISSLTASSENPPESDEKPSALAVESSPELWSDITCLSDSFAESPSPAVKKTVRSLTANQLKSVAPSEPDDTLDATWKAITEGRGARQLKKSETWDAPPRVEAEPEPEPVAARRELKKSETFNDESSSASSRGGEPGMTREMSSLSHDELNRRVEAFIQKFRLQRQDSYRQSMQKMNRVY